MNRRNRGLGGFALLAAVAIVACAKGNDDEADDPIVGADAATDALAKHDAAKDAGDSGRSLDAGGGQGDPDASPAKDVDASEDATVDPVDAKAPLDATADATADAKPDATDAAVDSPVSPVDSGLDTGIADTGVDARDASTGTDAAGFDAGDASTCPTGTPILVNEVQADGVGGGDEFVELYNPNACTLSLAGFTLKYSSATGSSPTAHWTGAGADAIAGHAYVVVAGVAFAGATTSVIGTFNGGTTGVLSKSGGAIGLHDAAGTFVDGVAYGTALKGNPEGEGSPALQPPSSQSIGRSATSAATNDNASDFSVAPAPTPGAHN